MIYYNDFLGTQIARHENARRIPLPRTVDSAVTLNRLTPLNWAASNTQHAVHNMSLTALPDHKANGLKLGMHDPDFTTWGLYNQQVP